MITLVLDASTYTGTVAVLEDQRVVVERAAAMRGKDAELLMPTVEQTLRDAGRGLREVERLVCGSGPGSFTSLRIAASLAKGMAVGRDLPLFAVSSLALIVAGNVTDGPREARRYLAALDAMRGESYVAEFEHHAGMVRQTGELRRLPSEEVIAAAESVGARPVGPDQAGHWLPRARGVALLLDAIAEDGPVNLAAWEPIYGRMAEAQVKWEAAHGRDLPR
jgi:tRNA threonylcarbamoyladenosine biosynthesis protein TsaB